MNTAASLARPRTAEQSVDRLRWFDGVWTAVATSAVLFSYTFGAKAAAMMLLLMPVYFAVRFRTAPRFLAATAPILLLPGFAMLSAIWSIEPGTTFYYGFQYFVTVMIGTAIGAGTDRRQALYGLFAAFLLFAVVSLGFGRSVGWGSGHAVAFAGMTGSKNAAADTAAVGLLVASAMLVACIRERRIAIVAAALGLMLIELWILRRAESTGSLAASAVAVMALVAWNLARLMTTQARTAIFLAIGAVMAVAALLQKFWLAPLVELLLKSAGKDATLTGRTYIWEKAFALIDARPVLGLGYNAFWRHGNIDAEGIWLFAGIKERAGFNFHNSFLEILVHLGYVGLALYGIVALAMFGLLLLRTMRAPNDMGILFCAYLSYVAVRLSIESQAFAPFNFSTVMVMAGLACAVWNRAAVASGPAPARRPAITPQNGRRWR
ncbi:O-antigen ligase family protein [Sphingomonas sp. MMS12-HWE2-04]|uniref:O-antigen ligase family protein n=1 Tax=Sphingomonas sp. MMS12-HWE2-04 TaxID=3234199 RepID=UPI003851291E